MKTTVLTIKYLAISLMVVLMVSCNSDDTSDEQQVISGIIDSGWFDSGTWSGSSGDRYFDKNAPELTAELVDNGIVLAYARLTGDDNSTRSLPANTSGDILWNYIVRGANMLRFTSTTNFPSTNNQFRYLIITSPSLTAGRMQSVDFSEMSLDEVLSYFNLEG